MTHPIPPFHIEACEHPRTKVIGLGMSHCPDCSTFWSNPYIGVVPEPDVPPGDDACICCGATDDLTVSRVVPFTLWDRERIPARLAGLPSIRKVARCRPCAAATSGTPLDRRCEDHGGRTVEFE